MSTITDFDGITTNTGVLVYSSTTTAGGITFAPGAGLGYLPHTSLTAWKATTGNHVGVLAATATRLAPTISIPMTIQANTDYRILFTMASTFSYGQLPASFTVKVSWTGGEAVVWEALPRNDSTFVRAYSNFFSSPTSSVTLTFQINHNTAVTTTALMIDNVQLSTDGYYPTTTQEYQPGMAYPDIVLAGDVYKGRFTAAGTGVLTNTLYDGFWYCNYAGASSGTGYNRFQTGSNIFAFLRLNNGVAQTRAFMSTFLSGTQMYERYRISFLVATSAVGLAPDTFTVTVSSGYDWEQVLWSTVPTADQMWTKVTTEVFEAPGPLVRLTFAMTRSDTAVTHGLVFDEVQLMPDTTPARRGLPSRGWQFE